jgi:Tfp pilus assembly protein PilF
MLLAAWRPRAPSAELLSIFCIGNSVSVVLFFIFARFRLPSVPPLIIFGASTIAAWTQWFKEKRFDRLALTAAGAIVLFVTSYKANLVGLPGQVASSSWVNLGDLYKESGDFSAAESALRNAVRQSPEYFPALNDLGMLLIDQKRPDEALQIFQKSLEINPAYANTYFYRALAFEATGQNKLALMDYSKTLQLSPRFSGAALRMANLLLKMGEQDAAEKYYREAIHADPLNARAHYNFGLQLVKNNKLPSAIEEFRQALIARPDYSTAYDGLGVAMLRSGDVAGARHAFQEALRIDAHDTVAQQNIKLLARY